VLTGCDPKKGVHTFSLRAFKPFVSKKTPIEIKKKKDNLQAEKRKRSNSSDAKDQTWISFGKKMGKFTDANGVECKY
jgi:hypothetical protein